jgi:hypothetical protein
MGSRLVKRRVVEETYATDTDEDDLELAGDSPEDDDGDDLDGADEDADEDE